MNKRLVMIVKSIKSIFFLALLINSSFAFANPTEVPYTRENVVAYDVNSFFVERNFLVEVSIPYSYYTNNEQYPVIYLVDGYNNFPIYKNMLELLSKDNLIPEVITIGIRYRPEDYLDEGNWRIADLTPTEIVDSESGELIGGNADAFLNFILYELKPFVNVNLRIDTENETFSGHSLGGLFALYALFTQPEAFDNYLVMSPSIWWDEKVIYEFEESYHSSHEDMNNIVYVTVGSKETRNMVKDSLFMYRKLKKRKYDNLDLKIKVLFNETHNSGITAATNRGVRYILGNTSP